MRGKKIPAVLATIVRSDRQQWFVAGVTRDGKVTPLVRSEPGNLDRYVGCTLDEQVSFLRHRLAGAFQRGFDRLWDRQMKTRQIVIVLEGTFPQGDPALPQSIAEHFHLWMTRPEATTFASQELAADDQLESYDRLAGAIESADVDALQVGWPELVAALEQPDRWEMIAKPIA